MQLLSSFDLMQNPLFSMQKEDWMMPTPFILNDAVVIKQRIKPSPPIVLEQQVIRLYKPKKSKQNY
jgi:hypothetical protein